MHPLHQSVIRLHLYGKELQRRGMLLAVGVGKGVNGLAVLIRGLGVGGAILSSVDIAVLGDDIQQALGEVPVTSSTCLPSIMAMNRCT